MPHASRCSISQELTLNKELSEGGEIMIEGGGRRAALSVDDGLVWMVLVEEVGRNSDAEDADARRASRCGLKSMEKVTAIREGSSMPGFTEAAGDFMSGDPGVDVS